MADKFHDARKDYCTCPNCMKARKDELKRRKHAEAREYAENLVIPVNDLYKWINRTKG